MLAIYGRHTISLQEIGRRYTPLCQQGWFPFPFLFEIRLFDCWSSLCHGSWMINACISLASLGASTADGCCMVTAEFGLALNQYILCLFACGVRKLPYDKVRRTKAGHYAVLSSTCWFILIKILKFDLNLYF